MHRLTQIQLSVNIRVKLPSLTTRKIKGGHLNKNYFIALQVLMVLLGAPFFALIDSPWFSTNLFDGQNIDNIAMAMFFVWFLFLSTRKLFRLMLITVLVSFCAELMGSKHFTLYQYRLDNIPPYIPLGHAIVYATAYQISRLPYVWKYHIVLENFLFKVAFIVCSMSLMMLNDCAGFICYLFFLLVLNQRKKPLFYLTLFAVTYYLELTGTITGAWSYYFVLGNHPNYPTTSVTPCGIAGIYSLVDLTSNNVYLYLQKYKKNLRKQAVEIIYEKTMG